MSGERGIDNDAMVGPWGNGLEETPHETTCKMTSC